MMKKNAETDIPTRHGLALNVGRYQVFSVIILLVILIMLAAGVEESVTNFSHPTNYTKEQG